MIMCLDFIKATHKEIQGKSTLFKSYKCSLFTALLNVYPASLNWIYESIEKAEPYLRQHSMQQTQ